MAKKTHRPITPKEDAQSVGFFAMFGAFFATYLGSEVVLALKPHPWHWLVAGIGTAIAGLLGYGITLWRLTHRR